MDAGKYSPILFSVATGETLHSAASASSTTKISQFRDALDAYSRVIRINPYVCEVWSNLGLLYESYNN